MLVTANSSVIACNQESKSSPNNVSQPQGDNTKLSDSETKKIPLRAAIAKNNLGLIPIETQPKPKAEAFIDIDQIFDLTPQILKRLVELNGKETIDFNPFDLAVAQPILINKFGDMKTTVTVLDRSPIYTGTVELYFSIAIGNEHLIRQTNLGTYRESQ